MERLDTNVRLVRPALDLCGDLLEVVKTMICLDLYIGAGSGVINEINLSMYKLIRLMPLKSPLRV